MSVLRKAFMPGTKDPNGWENGYVEPQATYQNVGSQTPIPHDRDGHPVEVATKGMMKIPGYEWHDKSPEFHKLAGRVKDLLADIAERASELDPSFDFEEDFSEIGLWMETEKPSAFLLKNPEQGAKNFVVWRKLHTSAKRVASLWSSRKAGENQNWDLKKKKPVPYKDKLGNTNAVFEASLYTPSSTCPFKDISAVVVLEKVSGVLDLNDWWGGSGYFSDAVKKAFGFNLRIKSKYTYKDLGDPIGEPYASDQAGKLVLVY